MTKARSAICAALCAAGFSSFAHADVVNITIGGANNDPSLSLTDGQWLQGRDWNWNLDSSNTANGEAWATEKWVGMSPVDLTVGVDTDGIDPDVTITKNLTNSTGVSWTSFKIDLLRFPGFGPLSIYPSSVASNRFSSVSVTNFGSGDAQMIFTLSGSDTPVLAGQSVSFFFTFNIPGDVAFRMVQTPIPAPGAAAVLGIAGLMAARRRR